MNAEEHKRAIERLEEIGDHPDFQNRPELIEEFNILAKEVVEYENIHFPIGKPNLLELEKLKVAYKEQ